tara:strand:+ start:1009 stop:1809 length:801 start_codon:yes stop_codon:yes gene_type:complete
MFKVFYFRLMDILKKIILNKKKEVESIKRSFPISNLEESIYFDRHLLSMKKSIIEKSGLISEFKRKSPSVSDINLNASVKDVAKGYELANSSGISILTDNMFFGGDNNDLLTIRDNISIPILRKDFIIDEYQIIESKSIGADIILLIASCLSKFEVKKLSKLSKSLDLEVLLEIHSEDELDYLNEDIDIVGVNNRNLKLFKTDINTSIKFSDLIPDHYCKISESGISSVSDINKLMNCGYNGFLIGENFMKHKNPVLACKKFIKSI